VEWVTVISTGPLELMRQFADDAAAERQNADPDGDDMVADFSNSSVGFAVQVLARSVAALPSSPPRLLISRSRLYADFKELAMNDVFTKTGERAKKA
jgi:hypothetical protein